MGVVVISFLIEAAYTDTPAAVLIPSGAFDRSAFYCRNRCADASKKVVSRMLSGVAIGAGVGEIFIMIEAKAFCNGGKYL